MSDPRQGGHGGQPALSAPALSAEQRAQLERGVALFNDRRFYECHDVLEELWSGLRGAPREPVQGLIQLAVGFYHLGHGNRAGAVRLFERGLRRLAGAGESWSGLELGALREAVAAWRQAAERRDGALPAEGPPRITIGPRDGPGAGALAPRPE